MGACSQKAELMTDAQFDGMKGKVKDVSFSDTIYDENGNIIRKSEDMLTISTYNEFGKKIKWKSFLQNVPAFETTYWENNGFNFSKSVKVGESKVTDDTDEPPRAKPNNNKLTVKDDSFDSKTKLNFDSNVNISEKITYLSGSLDYLRRTYEYDSNRNKVKETVFADQGKIYNDSTKYEYDSKGILISETNFGSGSGDESKARASHKLTYITVKSDSNGNWLERKVFDSISRRSSEGEPKLIRVEYQTVTYY